MRYIQNTMVPQLTPPIDASVVPANPVLTTAAGRYPKRARTHIDYSELEREESDCSFEDDSDELPPPSKRSRVSRSGKPRPKHKIFPFMNLPAEIRNKIYHDCLVSDQSDDQGRPSFYFIASKRRYRHTVTRCTRTEAVRNSTSTRSFRHRRSIYLSKCHNDHNASKFDDGVRPLITNVLATCKAIHAEAAPLLYQQRFIFLDSMALMNFMSECAPQTAALVRHIEVLDWLQTRSRKNVGYLAISILAAKGAVNLESLVVSGNLGWFHNYAWRQPNRMMEIQDRVARKVYKDFYPWLEMVGRAKGNMYEGLRVLDIGDATWHNSSARPKLDDEEQAMCLNEAYEKSLKKLIRENWLRIEE